jgi:hypothetical protein
MIPTNTNVIKVVFDSIRISSAADVASSRGGWQEVTLPEDIDGPAAVTSGAS